MYVGHVERDEAGNELIRKDAAGPPGAIALSKVVGVIFARTEELAPPAFSLRACANVNKQVLVMLGANVLPFPGMSESG